MIVETETRKWDVGKVTPDLMAKPDDPMTFSIYTVKVLRARDRWRCPDCKQGFRRVLKLNPPALHVYATSGAVRPDRACADCRARLRALGRGAATAAEVGGRLPGVDAPR